MGGCTSILLQQARINGEKRVERIYGKSWKKEALDLEAVNDQLLAQIRERISYNGSSSTASLFTKRGEKGVNQDAMILWEDFCSKKNTVFCGVFDGHGPNGHLVSSRVRNSLPSRLAFELHEELNSINPEMISNSSITSSDSAHTEECKEPEMFAAWQYSLLKACKVMDKELRLHPLIDCSWSGTTAVTILKQMEHLIIGNIGDSRAILGTKAENGALVAEQLTVDLKPNLPQEAERIKQCNGRVFSLPDEPEVHRVWSPDSNSSGLAVARSFGDFCLKEYGLIAVPEISYRRLTDKDQFIVLATDGIWDVLSNAEVVEIVSRAPSRAAAAKCVVKAAVRAWKVKRSCFQGDDCAAICLFVDTHPHPHSP